MRSICFGLLLAFALTDTHALAQPPAAGDLLWPPDCTRDMPRDGLLLLDRGALGGSERAQTVEVRLQRTSDGALVPGTLEAPGERTESLLRWRSHAPLQANTEYKVEALPRDDLAAQPMLSGYFTTGDAFLAPLAFSGRPAVRLLARAAQQPAAELAPETVLVRIALPPLTGGLPQRTLRVSATWSERDDAEHAAGLRGDHAQDATPGQTLGFELEAQLRDAPSERCLQIVARDDLGQELALEPALCVSLPAASAPAAHDPEAVDLDSTDPELDATETTFEPLASRQSAGDATGPSQSESAGGCALSNGGDGRGWAWLMALLPALLLRRRMRLFAG